MENYLFNVKPLDESFCKGFKEVKKPVYNKFGGLNDKRIFSGGRMGKITLALPVVNDAFPQFNNHIINILPVLPPEYRFNTGNKQDKDTIDDKEDEISYLYRQIILRNNRIYKLKKMKAPETILKVEGNLLQFTVTRLMQMIFNKYISEGISEQTRLMLLNAMIYIY